MNNRVINYREEYVGKTFETKSCGKCTVIKYENSRNVTVKFHEYPYIVRSTSKNIRNGRLLNPMYPSCCGVGYLGEGRYLSSDRKVFNIWYAMLQRVYDERYREKFPAYKDVKVCDEWLNFQNFADWCYKQKYFKAKDHNNKSYHLDKDLLSGSSKVYSPKTCCFLPPAINSLLQGKSMGKQPSGVYFRESRNMYEASVTIGVKKFALGAYVTSEEAFSVYKVAKERHIREVAEKWKGKIDDRAHEALMHYEIVNKEMSDGKN